MSLRHVYRAMSAASRLRMQYASDLHLELGDTPFQHILKPVAPVLVLAGDVGRPDMENYRNLLRYCSDNWDDVFVVAGNHEFYNTHPQSKWKWKTPDTLHKRLDLCEAVAAKRPNVHFLNRRTVMRDGVAFMGCTLWTNLSGHEGVAASKMNDFQMIAMEDGSALTPSAMTGLHKTDRAWLAREIQGYEEQGIPAVVITHHLPSHALISHRYAGSPVNACFASHCDALIRSPVRAWIAGHTHVGMNHYVKHRDQSVTQCVVNPRGYPREAGTGYSPEMFVDISTESGSGGDTRDPLLVAAAYGRRDSNSDSSVEFV
jgi:hypothetical protein